MMLLMMMMMTFDWIVGGGGCWRTTSALPKCLSIVDSSLAGRCHRCYCYSLLLLLWWCAWGFVDVSESAWTSGWHVQTVFDWSCRFSFSGKKRKRKESAQCEVGIGIKVYEEVLHNEKHITCRNECVFSCWFVLFLFFLRLWVVVCSSTWVCV